MAQEILPERGPGSELRHCALFNQGVIFVGDGCQGPDRADKCLGKDGTFEPVRAGEETLRYRAVDLRQGYTIEQVNQPGDGQTCITAARFPQQSLPRAPVTRNNSATCNLHGCLSFSCFDGWIILDGSCSILRESGFRHHRASATGARAMDESYVDKCSSYICPHNSHPSLARLHRASTVQGR